jgi:hypothetical protein
MGRGNMKSTTWLTAAWLRAILAMPVGSNNPSFGGLATARDYSQGRLLLASGGTPVRGQFAYLQQEEIACVNT